MQTYGVRNAFLISAAAMAIVFLHSSHFPFRASKAYTPVYQINPMVFEILEKDGGNEARGHEFLYFRFYEEGQVEFEDLHKSQSSEPVDERHTLKLGQELRDELMSLYRKLPSYNSYIEYDQLQPLKEKFKITIIKFKVDEEEVQIVINNYLPEHKDARHYYPDAIMGLMEKLRQIRKKYHRRCEIPQRWPLPNKGMHRSARSEPHNHRQYSTRAR